MSVPSRAYVRGKIQKKCSVTSLTVFVDVQRIFANIMSNAEGSSIEFETVVTRGVCLPSRHHGESVDGISVSA